jgi:type I restriction enzyme S subunit
MSAEDKVPAIRFKGFSGAWEDKKFNNIVVNLSGGASIAPNDYQKDGIRTIPKGAVNATGVADLSGSKYVSIDFYEKNILNKVSSEDLVTSLRDLVPTAPNMGRVVKIRSPKEDFLMPQGVYKIELKKGVDENFVIAYSNSEVFRKIISREKNGSTQVHLRNGEFLNIEIIRPKSEEQTKIGTYFQQLDTLLAQHQQKHDKLLNLKKALLEKMFPKQGATEPEIRFKGFSGKWEESSFSTIAESFDYGLNAAAKKYDGKNKYIRITDINEDTREFDVSDVTSPDANLSMADNYKLKLGDILFARTGASVGKTYIYRKQDGLVYFAGFLIRARIKENVNAEFVFQSTLTEKYNKFIRLTSQRSGQPGVNAQEYRLYNIFLPQQKEQTKIGNLFKQLDELITQHQAQLKKLGNIKQACLEKMFV